MDNDKMKYRLIEKIDSHGNTWYMIQSKGLFFWSDYFDYSIQNRTQAEEAYNYLISRNFEKEKTTVVYSNE
jgi:hypothetical protein